MKQSTDRVGDEVARIATTLLADSESLSATMAEQMRAHVPVYGTGVVTAEELQSTCFDNLHFVFGAMGRSTPADSPESRENGRQRARVGVPLTDVMAAYRIGARFMWDRLSSAAAHAPTEVVIRAAAEMWLVLDVYTQEMATGYRDEIAFQVAASATERGALIQAVLEGDVPEANLWDAAHALRLPLTGSYVAVVASVSELGRQPLVGVQRQLASASVTSIWQLRPDSETGIVNLRSGRNDLPHLRAALDMANARGVGISPQFADLRAVKSAVRLARLALRATSETRPVATYDNAPLSILASGLPEVMEVISEPILAGLTALPQQDAETLLATFGAWRDNGGSADRAAVVLFCHPNTVRYRLRRLEEATGRSLSDPRSATELGLAYEYDLARRTESLE